MNRYRLSYVFKLENKSGGFCLSPLDVMTQMKKAQTQKMTEIRNFLIDNGLTRDVKLTIPVPDKNEIVITCTPKVATALEQSRILSGISLIGPVQKAGPKP